MKSKRSLCWLVVFLMIFAMAPMQVNAQPPPPPVLISATTNAAGTVVTLEFDKDMADPSAEAGNFDVKIHGIDFNSGSWTYDIPISLSIGVSSAALNSDLTKIDLTLDDPLQRGDIITVDYVPGTVASVDTATLAAFALEPVTNVIPVVIDTDLEGTWEIFDHVGWWGENSFPTGDDPRGRQYNRHIVTSGSAVIFYGNGTHPFKDFLYLPSTETAAKSFSFELDLSGIKYHSMEGGGFLFNTIIAGDSISGYCALFINNYGTYAVNLYKLDNVDLSDFHDGLTPYYNLAGNPTGITDLGAFTLPTGDLHSITLEASSTSVDIWDGSTKLVDNFTLPTVIGNGVGIIGSYQYHGCNELSWFIYSDLTIQGVADLSATLAGTEANLVFTAPEGATSVTAEQSTDGAIWAPATLAAPITETSTTATVTGLTPNQTYYFRLDITGGTFDGYSRIATAAYVAGAINNLAATPGNGLVNLTFTPPDGALGLEVMQSTDGGVNWTPSALSSPIGPTSSAATVTGLTNGVTYKFKIIVEVEEASFLDSNIVSATPAAPTSRRDRDSTIIEELVPLAEMVDHMAYIQGYPDNKVRPEGYITREEAAAVFYRLMDPVTRETNMTDNPGFKDVSMSRWSAKHIATLAKAKIISGYPDGTFEPKNFITRAELAVLASKFDSLSPSQENMFPDIMGHWAASYINSAAQKGWATGYVDGTFKPDQYITRAEFVTLVNKVFKRSVKEENILSNAKQFPDLAKGMWYYEDMMEAINGHLGEMMVDNTEKWTELHDTMDEM